MTDLSSTAPALGQPALTLRRPGSGIALVDKLASVAQQSGLGHGEIVRRYARFAAGPGRPSFDDFVRLRLFEAEAAGGAAPFIGARRNLQLCTEINFRHDWFCMLTDKVASQRYLDAHGCPTLPIAAIFRPGLAFDAGLTLRDRAALEAFLLRPDHYPLFGKPVDGCQSLGTGAYRRCWPGARELERMDGSRVGAGDLADEIATHYAAGYVFQPLGRPHPDVRALCGERLATARMVTIWDEGGPKLFRAAVKVPAGGNWADNFWRSGNILAGLSAGTGRVARAVAGAGLQARPVDHHPDTGAAVVGFVYPEWDAMKALAVEAARLMRHVPFIGWDIACTDRGPVIVEMNATPDLFLVQFADRRGVLDGEFDAFRALQRRRHGQHRAERRKGLADL